MVQAGRSISLILAILLCASCNGENPVAHDVPAGLSSTISVKAHIPSGLRLFEISESGILSGESEKVGDDLFKVEIAGSNPTSACTYYALSPSTASKGTTSSMNNVRLTISPSQTSVINTSFNSDCIQLADKYESASRPSEISLNFRQQCATGRISLKGMLPVSEVSFMAIKGESPVPVAGTTSFNLTESGPVGSYADIYSEKSIRVICNDAGYTGDNTQTICFSCWPFSLEAGDRYAIGVLAGGQTISYSVTIPDGKTLDLTAGGVTDIPVSMSDPTPGEVGPLRSLTVSIREGVTSAEIDHENGLAILRHIPEAEAVTGVSVDCSGEYEIKGEWPEKTIICSRPGYQPVQYRLLLADFISQDDYFRTCNGSFDREWNILWSDEFKTDGYDHKSWYQCEAGPSYWDDHMDPSDPSLVTMDPAKDSKHVGHVSLWARKGNNKTAQKTYNGVVYPLYDGYVTGGIQGGVNRAGEHFYHPTLPPEGKSAYRVDIRMSAGKAKGFWPAVWMTSPDSKTPYLVAGEMDLAEILTNRNRAYQTCHNIYSNANSRNFSCNSVIAYTEGEDNWVLYTVIVDNESLRYYMNGVLTLTYKNEGKGNDYFPYNTGYHYQIILSAQLGNSEWMWYSDAKPDGSGMPVCMKVDFVRIYCK